MEGGGGFQGLIEKRTDRGGDRGEGGAEPIRDTVEATFTLTQNQLHLTSAHIVKIKAEDLLIQFRELY